MRAALLVLVGAIAAVLAACGTGDTETSERSLAALTAPSTSATTTTTAPKCVDVPPRPPTLPAVPSRDEAAAADEFMRNLEHRTNQQLVVAVDENTVGLSSRNPATGRLEGTEIDVAKRIAQDVFGGNADDHVKFVTVTTKQKVDFPRDRTVDLAISAISITCTRASDVAFSDPYLRTEHEYLVPQGSPIHDKRDVAGARVCMTKGSTSIAILDGYNDEFRRERRPQAKPVLVDTRNDCHLQLQEGTVDAYLGHATFLRGMLDQDPGVRAVNEGTISRYAIAMSKKTDHTYFVQYVNAMLADLRAEGVLPALASVDQGRTE